MIQTLVNKSVWFSFHPIFNDPFDCALYIDKNRVTEAVKGTIKISSGEKGKYREIIDDPDFEVIQSEIEAYNQYRESMNQIFNDCGILCLSSDEKNLLM